MQLNELEIGKIYTLTNYCRLYTEHQLDFTWIPSREIILFLSFESNERNEAKYIKAITNNGLIGFLSIVEIKLRSGKASLPFEAI